MESQVTAPKSSARPAALPVVGNLHQFARDPLQFLDQLHQAHGDVAPFRLMNMRACLISHPKDIERVLLETGKRYGKGFSTHALRTVLGNGLVTSEGDFWKRQRKLAAPAFHHQSIKQYGDQMVAYAQDLAQTWPDGAERDIHQDMMTLTQRIIMKVLFDADMLQHADQASAAFNAMMHGIDAEMRGLDAVLPGFVPTPARARMAHGVDYINGLLQELIAQRQAEGAARRDLLTMLMEARDDDGQPMSTAQLLDEIRSLYLAGHETTATTLSWTWLLLSRNPAVYARLESEIETVLQGRAPTADDVPHLPYSNAVIKEALRCYPVAWTTQRIALEDVEIGGVAIPQDTALFLSPWVVHHDARWYTDPEAFQPERWLVDKADQPPREAYLPFGGGPHICIGNGLAMLEAVLLLATLLQHAHLAVQPDHPVAIGLAGTLRPKHGLRATVTRRGMDVKA